MKVEETPTFAEDLSFRRKIYPATAALVIIVAATALLQPAAAAPVSQAIADDFDSWWYNACGHHSVLHPSRHSNHAANCAKLGDFVPKSSKNQVRQQMKIFRGNFDVELKSINETYSKVKGFIEYTQPAFEWLPKFKKPTKPKRTKAVLRNYHEDLQKYVVAVHYLATLKLETEAEFEWQNKRAKLLTKLSDDMKGLLCEIETAVNATCQTLPARIPASFAHDQGLNHKLNAVTDLYLMDFGVLSRFHTFMDSSSELVSYLPKQKESNSVESKVENEDPATLSAETGGE